MLYFFSSASWLRIVPFLDCHFRLFLSIQSSSWSLLMYIAILIPNSWRIPSLLQFTRISIHANDRTTTTVLIRPYLRWFPLIPCSLLRCHFYLVRIELQATPTPKGHFQNEQSIEFLLIQFWPHNQIVHFVSLFSFILENRV